MHCVRLFWVDFCVSYLIFPHFAGILGVMCSATGPTSTRAASTHQFTSPNCIQRVQIYVHMIDHVSKSVFQESIPFLLYFVVVVGSSIWAKFCRFVPKKKRNIIVCCVYIRFHGKSVRFSLSFVVFFSTLHLPSVLKFHHTIIYILYPGIRF